MTPYQLQLHKEHLERKKRLYAAAWKPPTPPSPPPSQKKIIPLVRLKEPPRSKPIAPRQGEDFRISLDMILHQVCLKHGIDRTEMANLKLRDHKTTAARFEYFYRGRMETDLSYERIGKLTGHDHTSVRHGAIAYAARNRLALRKPEPRTTNGIQPSIDATSSGMELPSIDGNGLPSYQISE